MKLQQSEFWIQHHEAAVAMRAAGMSFSKIAEKLGVTKNAVVGRMYRTGLIETRLPQEHEKLTKAQAAVVEMRNRGMTEPQIGAALGLTRSSVNNRYERARAKLKRNAARKQRERRIEFPSSGHCVFISGDLRKGGHFCGAPTPELLRPYCDAHAAVCYLPARKTREVEAAT